MVNLNRNIYLLWRLLLFLSHTLMGRKSREQWRRIWKWEIIFWQAVRTESPYLRSGRFAQNKDPTRLLFSYFKNYALVLKIDNLEAYYKENIAQELHSYSLYVFFYNKKVLDHLFFGGHKNVCSGTGKAKPTCVWCGGLFRRKSGRGMCRSPATNKM